MQPANADVTKSSPRIIRPARVQACWWPHAAPRRGPPPPAMLRLRAALAAALPVFTRIITPSRLETPPSLPPRCRPASASACRPRCCRRRHQRSLRSIGEPPSLPRCMSLLQSALRRTRIRRQLAAALPPSFGVRLSAALLPPPPSTRLVALSEKRPLQRHRAKYILRGARTSCQDH